MFDVRRKFDVYYFRESYDKVLYVWIIVIEEVRRLRGWIFILGVDDIEFECGFDDEEFDVFI